MKSIKVGQKFVTLLTTAAIVGMAGCNVYVTPRHAYVYSEPAVVYASPQPAYVAYPSPQPLPPQAAAPAQSAQDAQLQQLVAPIALYPDPLLAEVLTASTYPQQVQAAAQWLQANPEPSQAAIDVQPWDPTVKALVHYPTVLQYMAGNYQWTMSLGSAYASQAAEVNAAIQDLRSQSYAVGSLRTTPEQVVVQQGPYIYIQPANPDVIYVPAYDPALVYVQVAPITFGVGFAVGPWLGLGFDWGYGGIFVGDWRLGWQYGAWGWRRDPFFHPAYRFWGHDGRWGPAPHVDHFTFHGDFRGRAFRPVPARHAAGHYGGGRGGHEDRR